MSQVSVTDVTPYARRPDRPSREEENIMNGKIRYVVGVSSLVLALSISAPPARAESGQERQTDRQDARDTRQTGRDASRDVKAACKEGDNSRAECRQHKRDVKHGARHAAHDKKTD